MHVEQVCLSQNVLLHIGYHKTATTWFQTELFSRAELGFHMYEPPREIVHSVFCNPDPFSAPPANDISRLIAEANEATDSGNCYVISHERLSGYPASGGFDATLIADRLLRHFPNARIFCLFREQRAMIYSMWRQQIVDGGGASLKGFLQPAEPRIFRMPSFSSNTYKYSRLLKHYVELCGQSNVLFYPYEAFCLDPAEAIGRLGVLVGNNELAKQANAIIHTQRKPNPSIAIPILHIQRALNIFFAKTQMSPNCIVNLGSKNIRGAMRLLHRIVGTVLSPIDTLLQRKGKQTVAQHCHQLFDEDNAVLSELVGQQLSTYGYSVASHVEEKGTDEY